MARTPTTAIRPKTLSARLREDQSGAVIILALAFLTVILALAVGIIGLSWTGSSSLRAYRLERHRRYAADAALQSALHYVRANPGLGVSASPPACAMNYAVQQDVAPGGAMAVFTPGSVLNVTCKATPGVTDSGARELDLRGEPTGGQGPRDVTFEVSCAYSTMSATGPLSCGSGGNTVILGRSRVRYDIDFSIVPTKPDCGPYDDSYVPPVDPNGPGNLCSASSVRAVVPKIMLWSLKGG